MNGHSLIAKWATIYYYSVRYCSPGIAPVAGATRTPLLLLRESPCYGHGQRVLGRVRQTPLVLPTV